MAATNSLVWIDKLEDATAIINHRPHRSLGNLTPSQAERPENHAFLVERNRQRWRKQRQQRAKLKLGDQVRILERRSMQRGYQPQFSSTIYTIVETFTNLKKPRYAVLHPQRRYPEFKRFEAEELSQVLPAAAADGG